MSDLPLFQNHSETSRSAARSIAPQIGPMQRRVLETLSDLDGATDEEIIALTRLSPSTARPRRIELVEKGLARDSGLKKPTASGRPATIWRATDKGRALLAETG